MKNPNSQVSGISHSLLSEPPDIKNWFSSYTYQSPILGSNEDFCISPTGVDEGENECIELYVEDSEDEKIENYVNLTKSRRSYQADIDRMKNGCHFTVPKSDNEARKLEIVPDDEVSGISNSILSEPPDIKNWFSSYTYQSPILGSNEDFCISPAGVDERENECLELYVEDSEDEKVENYVNLTKSRRFHQADICRMKNGCHSTVPKSDNEAGKLEIVPNAKIPAYPDSLPLSSEPPDIANWFSSYAYESPELDSADFDFPLSPNHTSSNSEMIRKKNEEHLMVPAAKFKVDLPFCREINSNGSEMNAGSTESKNSKQFSAAQTHISERNNFPPGNDLCSKVTSLGDSYSKSDEPDTFERSRADNLTPIMHEGQETNAAENLIFSAKAPCRERLIGTREYKTQNVSQVSVDDSGWIQLNRKSREAYCTKREQEEKQYLNDENVPQRLGSRKCKIDKNINLDSFSKDKRVGPMTREVLKETTNIKCPCTEQSSGKWRCPQKNKPNTGPPLKQLRLEKWVHRI